MKKLHLSFLVFLVVILFTVAFSSCHKDDDNPTPSGPATITQIVSDNPDFSILKAAVLKVGLADALAGGTLTVFAPDNAAFAAAGISAATIESLPVSSLDSILKYHVVGASVASSAVPASDTVKTLLGLNLYASKNANGVFVNGVKVKTADVVASNGVIHVISNVLMPPTKTIAGIASGNPDFSLLVAAVIRAGLLDVVSGPGKYTVFAPTNAAFQAAGFNTVDDINEAPQDVITEVVKYHVLGTNVFASDLTEGATPTSIQGGTLTIGLSPAANVKVTGGAETAAAITTANIVATNGVIHVIDKVLMP